MGKVLAVVGSRDYNNYEEMCKQLDGFFKVEKPVYDKIISGGARGADTLADRYAKDNSIHFVQYPADWKRYGKEAGYRRNVDMAEDCDACIAFWDGKSKGTKMMIDICNKLSKRVFIFKSLVQ